jgi:hypothetical protein
MDRTSRQTERTRTDDDSSVDDDSFDTDRDRSRGGRATVSDRTSWSGLAKRAYNVAVSRSGRSRSRSRGRSSSGGTGKLAVAMIAGAFVAGLIPVIPFTWLVGAAAGAAVAGWADEGSALWATLVGGVIGLIGGLGFAPALFGLGIFLTLALAVAGAVAGGGGYLAGDGRV